MTPAGLAMKDMNLQEYSSSRSARFMNLQERLTFPDYSVFIRVVLTLRKMLVETSFIPANE